MHTGNGRCSLCFRTLDLDLWVQAVARIPIFPLLFTNLLFDRSKIRFNTPVFVMWQTSQGSPSMLVSGFVVNSGENAKAWITRGRWVKCAQQDGDSRLPVVCSTGSSDTINPVVCNNLCFFFFFVPSLLKTWIHTESDIFASAPWSCARLLCVPHSLSLLCLERKKKKKKSGQGQCTNVISEHDSFACTKKPLNCIKLELMVALCVFRVCLCSPSSSRSPWCRGGHVTHYCSVAAGNCSASSQIHNLRMIMIYF